ncbi:hypothetical protein [Streptomyces qinzhouensis]|uniref:Uncharacterized protein n=1 Tax=Streptomyces qinzhouensis TaxID=2599401 RepID=A0A5B8JBS5_9ACTN|nr:hypothetical protein [Streptomyces qinzhouensis]QDY77914.1 hypothetical protein FQU76_16970 [Streptomyces qinzhouensis]
MRRPLKIALVPTIALAFSAIGPLPASPAAAASTTWSCSPWGWHYPASHFEATVMLCLGESLGQLTPSLTSECKQNDSLAGWVRKECTASNLNYRLTSPDGTVYNGKLPDGTGYYFDIYGTTTHKCAVGEWTYEQQSTHTLNTAAGGSGDTSETHKINVASCS